MASFVDTRGHAGDERDFEALYETYKSDVQRLASYLLKNASDAEDAAQTVFLNVLRALRQGVKPSDPRAWLLAITRNVCFSRHRAAAARPALVELDFETPGEPSGEETPSADEIVGALARMLPNQRTALILRDFRGVSRSEIGHLMALSPVAVEALLTRARTAFREELQAGEQPFACAETRALVEQQLDGLITVANRHSLRSHLRHCGPCATLARAVRSSRGKVAGLIFWPFDLISRLAGAFSQASSVTHVAAAITSTAAVAAVVIPVAVSTSPGPALAAWPATAAVPSKAAASGSPAAARIFQPSAPAASRSKLTRPAPHKPVAHAPARAKTASHTSAAPKRKHVAKTVTGTNDSGTIRTATPIAAAPQPSPPAVAAGSASPSKGIVTPGTASPQAPTPRSSAIITRPSAKTKHDAKAKTKPRTTRKSSRRRGTGRHEPSPPDVMPGGTTPPAAGLPPADSGASSGSAPGVAATADSSPSQPSTSSSSQDTGSQGESNPASDSSPAIDSGDTGDNGKDKSKDKGGDPGKHGKH